MHVSRVSNVTIPIPVHHRPCTSNFSYRTLGLMKYLSIFPPSQFVERDLKLRAFVPVINYCHPELVTRLSYRPCVISKNSIIAPRHLPYCNGGSSRVCESHYLASLVTFSFSNVNLESIVSNTKIFFFVC